MAYSLAGNSSNVLFSERKISGEKETEKLGTLLLNSSTKFTVQTVLGELLPQQRNFTLYTHRTQAMVCCYIQTQ